MAYISSRGVDVVTTIDDAKASKSRRVFLHSADPFNSSNVGFTIDSIPGALTLPDMTETAIEHMNKVSPDKFFMMVEGGNIDHVGHGNDGGTVAVEVVNFDQALAKAYDFYLQHPDETVIIVTADHETGGLSIGNGTVGYTSHTEYIPYQRMSKDMFSRKGAEFLKNGTPSWEDVKQFTAECTGLWSHVPVSEKQEAELKALYDRAMSGNTEQANEKRCMHRTQPWHRRYIACSTPIRDSGGPPAAIPGTRCRCLPSETGWKCSERFWTIRRLHRCFLT